MSVDLKKITKGREKRPPKVLIYGQHGLGKTGFAAGVPNALLLDTDRGSHKHDVAQRIIPESWNEALEWISAVETGHVKCDALVIDSVTQLEALGHQEFFGGEAISAWKGGYGKGDDYALLRWRELVNQLERVWRTGKTVVLVGHAVIKGFDDPMGPAYDHYSPAARSQISGFLSQWADYVLFARQSVSFQKVGDDQKAIAGDVRLYTRGTPAYWAKARGTTVFPESILVGWTDFMRAVEEDEQRASALGQEIEGLLAELGDEKVSASARAFLKDHPASVLECRNRLVERLKEKKAGKP
jgi:hypothetical protein